MKVLTAAAHSAGSARRLRPAPIERPGPALLALLRRRLGRPALAFAEPPRRLAGGNNNYVWAFRLRDADGPDAGGSRSSAWSGPLVLRLLGPANPPGAASLEAGLLEGLVGAGYPAPRALTWEDDPQLLGAPFQVMERVPGRPLLRVGDDADMGADRVRGQILRGLRQLLLVDWPGRLAALHVRLHRLDPGPLREALAARGLDPERLSLRARVDALAALADELGEPGLRRGAAWLAAHRPPQSAPHALCHGDFFPNQILWSGGRGRVVDWSEALVAPAEVDVGITVAGIASVPVPFPGLLGRVAHDAQRWLVRRYLGAYREHRLLDPAALRYGEVLRCVSVLAHVAERRAALAGALPRPPRPNPFDHPLAVARLEAHVEAAAGLDVRIGAPPPAPAGAPGSPRRPA